MRGPVVHIGGIDGPTVSLRLVELEHTIQRGLTSFIEVGRALRTIRDERLYLETHETFELYCRQRWGFTASRARQVIDAGVVAEAIQRYPGNTRLTEKHVRPLVGLAPEERDEAWREAVDSAPDGKVTGKHVELVVAKLELSKHEAEELVQSLPADVVLARAKQLRRQRTRESFHSSESAEWYSPAEPVELARELMGGIDLDPASSPEANEVVRAERIFTAADNGLAQEWRGRVWLNWPGGRNEDDESNAEIWSAKLVAEHKAGRAVEAVVMLFNAATDRGWFRRLWDFPICFVYGRLRFRRPGGEVGNQPLQPNGLVYLGPHVDRFAELFSRFGRIVVPRGHLSEVVA